MLERGTLLVDMPDIVWGDLSIDTAAIRMYKQRQLELQGVGVFTRREHVGSAYFDVGFTKALESKVMLGLVNNRITTRRAKQ